jgi:hypothetical protein
MESGFVVIKEIVMMMMLYALVGILFVTVIILSVLLIQQTRKNGVSRKEMDRGDEFVQGEGGVSNKDELGVEVTANNYSSIVDKSRRERDDTPDQEWKELLHVAHDVSAYLPLDDVESITNHEDKIHVPYLVILATYVAKEKEFDVLMSHIDTLKSLYSDLDICIVVADNESPFDVESRLPSGVHYVRNSDKRHKYEPGAYRAALRKFHPTKALLATQYNLICNERLPLSKLEEDVLYGKNVSSHMGWRSNYVMVNYLRKMAMQLYRNDLKLPTGTIISCSFAMHAKNIDYLLNALRVPSIRKENSIGFERLLWIMARHHNMSIRSWIGTFKMTKYHGGSDKHSNDLHHDYMTRIKPLY